MTLYLKNLILYKEKNDRLFGPLDIKIRSGEVLCLMGPSGCGKSTLLDAIAGHLKASFTYSGDIILNDKKMNNVAVHEREIGILFQDDLLFPHLRVWENLAFALPNNIKSTQRKNAAFDALSSINLVDLAEHYPEQLSGGQRARISLIRMLLAKPKLALLDEPFSKLDKALRKQFRDWVFLQLKYANIPSLLVTHDLDDVPANSILLTWPWSEKC